MRRSFIRDTSGAMALIVGLSLPIALAAAGAVVEYSSLVARRSKLQLAADSAALAAAREMSIANTSEQNIQTVARNVASGILNTPPDRTSIIDATATGKQATVDVRITETVPSVLGRLLTLPSTTLSVISTGQLYGNNAPLCMLALDGSRPDTLVLERNSQLTATGCAIYGNSTDPRGLRAESGAKLTAALICTAGGYSFNGATLSPDPTTDCPALADPLASRSAPPIGSCVTLASGAGPGPAAAPGGPAAGENVVNTTMTLNPGTYCGGLHVTGKGSVTLTSGVYVMKDGPLVVDQQASLTGQNVGFYFTGQRGGIRFDPDTTVGLSAPKDGPMVSLLFSEDPSVTYPIAPPPGPKGSPPPPPTGSPPMREYRITSNNARTMLGTIYLPVGRVIIDSATSVADQSAYTVIVARQVDLFDGPNLVLNTDYGATDIPLPAGVGSNVSRKYGLSR